MSERYGMASWATPVIDPSGVELKMLDNCLPVVYEPYAIYFADVGVCNLKLSLRYRRLFIAPSILLRLGGVFHRDRA
jgi:hypothetical protein